jgi:hypothetical protein
MCPIGASIEIVCRKDLLMRDVVTRVGVSATRGEGAQILQWLSEGGPPRQRRRVPAAQRAEGGSLPADGFLVRIGSF